MVFRALLPHLAKLRDDAAGAAGAALDRALVTTALELSRRSPERESVARDDHAESLRVLARVAETYAPHLDDPSRFFITAPAPTPRIDPVRALPRAAGAVVDLSWASGFETVHSAPRDAYHAHVENRTAWARTWLHPTPAPAIVCVHGYLGGRAGFEETSFSVEWLYGLGLDVALPVLPFHAQRCPSGRQGMFPGRDPWRTVEGFAQAIFDLRALIAWLRARGAPSVTVFGMSLGAYTSALLATVSDDVDHAALMVPLASLADAYLEHREGRDDAPPEWLRARIDDAYRVVSPLARAPRIASDRALVLAASGDRITRGSHAERLRAHFDAERHDFPGGHILQVGRGKAFGTLARFLSRHGVIAGR
jgi:dienelactone hydrolase